MPRLVQRDRDRVFESPRAWQGGASANSLPALAGSGGMNRQKLQEAKNLPRLEMLEFAMTKSCVELFF